MSDTVIRVENLSKRYRIGSSQGHFKYGSLRDSLANAVKAPFRRLRSSSDSLKEAPKHIWALKDVSFEVKRGEVLGIIGRNGAGKTTLLKILSRITKPTEGHVRLRGRVGSLLEVGTGFHPELTGRENIYLNGAVLGMKRIEIDRKFDEIVDFAEIEQFLDTPIKHYSSGMYMRLAFAVAAHMEPDILLIDEVLAVGDLAFQKKCLGKMEKVTQEGRAIIFISHNMNSISHLCNRVIWIDLGRIISDGNADDVISNYLKTQQSFFKNSKLKAEEWNIRNKSHKFFKEITINGISLPAEIVLKQKSELIIQIIGESDGMLLRNFRSGVHISSEEGGRIMTYGTPWSAIGDINIKGKVSLTCKIEGLPLIPGRYLISLGCSTDHGSLDWLENICFLTITPDKQNSSRLPQIYKTHGYFLTESFWDIEEL